MNSITFFLACLHQHTMRTPPFLNLCYLSAYAWTYQNFALVSRHYRCYMSIMELHERHGVSNQYQLDYLFNSLFILTALKTKKARIAGPSCLGADRGDSLHKGIVMWKAFPRHDVIMRKEMNNAFEKKIRIRFLAKWQNTNGVSPSVHGHLITVTSHEHHGVINPRDSDCLFNSSFMLTRKEIELQSASLNLYEEKRSMDSFDKGLVIRKTCLSSAMPWCYQLFWLKIKNKKTLWTSTPIDSSNNDSSEMKMTAKQFWDILWSYRDISHSMYIHLNWNLHIY